MHAVTAPPDPFLTRFLARVPAETRASFSAAQLDAVRRAFGMRHASGHAIDWRRTLRLPWGRWYVVLLVGRDRRGGRR